MIIRGLIVSSVVVVAAGAVVILTRAIVLRGRSRVPSGFVIATGAVVAGMLVVIPWRTVVTGTMIAIWRAMVALYQTSSQQRMSIKYQQHISMGRRRDISKLQLENRVEWKQECMAACS